jgi:uncharacterized protein (TIGR02145 family)
LTGPIGPQGVPGNDGAVGPQGPIGLTGPTGPQGVPGNDGAVGPQGPIGLTGPTGPQGAAGSDGATGPQGPQGVPGPQGPQGPQGSFPAGTQPGEMNYWNGTAWVSVPPGINGQVLTFCNGVPSWNGCFPSVITTPISNITLNSAITGGNVVSPGISSVTARGVAYNTVTNPTTLNNTTSNGAGVGVFTTNLIGLTHSTTYYVRAYATNSVGTAYGNEVSFTTTSSNSLQDGLIAWWPFNSNTNDESGNGNHGVNNGAVLTTDRFNGSNSAYLLSGSSQHINLGNTLPSGNSTISFWFNPTFSIVNRPQHILTKRSSCLGGFGEDFFQTYIYPSSNQIGAEWGNGGGNMSQPRSFVSNQWNHFVVVRDGDSMAFYLNGLFLEKVFAIPRNNTVPIRISNNFCQFGAQDWYDGKIDDIGIWNRALSALDVTQLYNSNSSLSFSLPTVTTISATSVTTTSATMGGNVTSDGGASVTARGVAYGMAQNPTISGTITSNGTGTGVFTSALTGLTASTLYYVRAYATNSAGTAYGNEVSFTTLSTFTCGTTTISDVDNNTYATVQIGTQCWTQSNLKVSKYRNGDNIPTGLSDAQWGSTTSGAYAIYDNDPVNDALYGKLYNWYAVTDSRGLCPTGWHVPSNGEWNVLVKYLDPNADTVCVSCGQSLIAGGALKSTAMQPTPGGWNAPNTGATNSSGFTGLPGGYRASGGGFYSSGYGYWWSSSDAGSGSAWYYYLSYLNAVANRNNRGNHRAGYSVRCARD